jgi:GTP-binding protein Era
VNSESSQFKSGYIAIVGWPNVGKSTLMNTLLGTKLSIVSPKPQTTRHSILGILNEPKLQMIFVDTPGWLKPIDAFQSFMKRYLNRSLFDDADVLLWVVEPRLLREEEMAFGQTLNKTQKPILIAVSKVDTIPHDEHRKKMLALVQEQLHIPADNPVTFHAVSSHTGEGLSELKSQLVHFLPLASPYFPTDQITDRWERFFVAELIREQIFNLVHEEVPYASVVRIDEFKERPAHKDYIKASILVETEGQKRILLGRKGSLIKEVGQRSRGEIEARLGRNFHLDLIVKVKKNWRKDVAFLKQLEELR